MTKKKSRRAKAHSHASAQQHNSEHTLHGQSTSYSVGMGNLHVHSANGPISPDELRPGLFSVRPPGGELPTRVRGREELISNLQEKIGNPADQFYVLHGLGGAGKTTVALTLAAEADRAGTQTFWIDASTALSITTGMKQVAYELGLPEHLVKASWEGRTSAVDLVWGALERANLPWVLVFDNADDPKLLGNQAGNSSAANGWVRPSRHGLVLVTSRDGAAAAWGNRAKALPVDPLLPSDGAEMLVDLAGTGPGTLDEAKQVAEELGGLPLAIRLAGSYLARSTTGIGLLSSTLGTQNIKRFRDYAVTMRQSPNFVLDTMSAASGKNISNPENEARRLVTQTWELSLDLLQSQGDHHARPLLRFLSCFAPSAFPAEALRLLLGQKDLPAGWSDIIIQRSMDSLINVRLIDIVEVKSAARDDLLTNHVDSQVVPCLSMHRLVREVNSHHLNHSSGQEKAQTWRLVGQLAEAASNRETYTKESRTWWALIGPHLRAALVRVPSDNFQALESLCKACLRLVEHRAFAGLAAGELSAELLAASASLGESHPLRLSILHRNTLFNNSQWFSALDEYVRIEEKQCAAGASEQEILITRHQCATVLNEIGEIVKAETLLSEVYRDRSRLHGPLHPFTLLTLASWVQTARKGSQDWAGEESKEKLDWTVSKLLKGEAARFLPDLDVYDTFAAALTLSGDLGRAEALLQGFLSESEWPEQSSLGALIQKAQLERRIVNVLLRGKDTDSARAMHFAFRDQVLSASEDISVNLDLLHLSADEFWELLPDVAEETIQACLRKSEDLGLAAKAFSLKQRLCLGETLEHRSRCAEGLRQFQIASEIARDDQEVPAEVIGEIQFRIAWHDERHRKYLQARHKYEVLLESLVSVGAATHFIAIVKMGIARTYVDSGSPKMAGRVLREVIADLKASPEAEPHTLRDAYAQLSKIGG
jgi:hypothetical protein